MHTAYEATLRALYALAGRGVRPGLDRVREALHRLGDPQLSLRIIHVAGTNGKGSVSAMVAQGLRAAGLRTGLYTSPHLHRFTERIHIDGAEIEPDAVVEAHARLVAIGDVELTYFESVTVMALALFAERGCDAAVLEVGLGGRLDATNAVDSKLACAITSIGLDHQAYLGDTIELIAREKAGILARAVPAVVGVRDPAARAVIEQVAAEVSAPLVRLGQELEVAVASGGAVITQAERKIEALSLGLRGAHQLGNAAVAAGVLWALADRGLPIDERAIRSAIEDVRWPGRLERIGHVVLDAAHNPQGFAALAAHVRSLARPRALVFGAMADKDWRAMLGLLEPEVDAIVLTAARGLTRAERPERLAQEVRAAVAPDVPAALALASKIAGRDGTVVVAGSIFVMAEARALLLGEASDPPIAM